jgi:hypothetical protein
MAIAITNDSFDKDIIALGNNNVILSFKGISDDENDKIIVSLNVINDPNIMLIENSFEKSKIDWIEEFGSIQKTIKKDLIIKVKIKPSEPYPVVFELIGVNKKCNKSVRSLTLIYK